MILMGSFMSKKDRKKLIQLINNTRLNNENDIWDLAVELENMSVRLRAEVLRRHEFDE